MRIWIMMALMALAAASPAMADERFPPVADAATLKECGACHLAFPPQLLPQRSWRRLMDTLPNHFGEDASLPDAQRAAITAYLVANANDASGQQSGRGLARGLAADQTPLRITELPRWVREHRKVKAAEWTSPRVKSKANCVACHKGAATGVFDDD